MTAHTETFFASASLAHRFAALRAQLVEASAKRKTYRATLDELDRLSNRDLADLGIARTQIEAIARQAVYGA